MKRNREVTYFLLIVFCLITGCKVLKGNGDNDFDLKDSYYQSWMVNENEKGTQIIVEITNVRKGVEFDSIVFRGNRLPVYGSFKNSSLILKGILNVATSKLAGERDLVNIPDQLIYHIQGTKHYYLLKNVRREAMKYY